MTYPENDDQFREVKIVEVDQKRGWMKFDDGFSFGIPADGLAAPAVGMTARLYGKGIGFKVRGLFLDGEKVYYRTEDEDRDHFDAMIFGKDSKEWLAKWDKGETVWSVEMGGLGPGYEQIIQIIAAEILRVFLDKKYDYTLWVDNTVWKLNRNEMESIVTPIIESLCCTGAQFAGAMNIATKLYRFGPIKSFTDPTIKDRLIQVSKQFPHL